MNVRLLVLLLLLSANVYGQIEVAPELPDNTQEGDLNTNTQVNGDNVDSSYNTTKNYNGAGSSGMPVNTAISPSLMASGADSCLKTITGGIQLAGVGASAGKYVQDEYCNRRKNALVLSGLGMKVAAVSLMCQDPNVWLSMYMSATPCPLIKTGKLIVGRSALIEIKRNPELHVPNYKDKKEFFDNLLGVGTSDTTEVENTTSVSDRFRSSLRD